MLLAFVVCSIIALTIANPLHKYPYVFLLDVGNEELEKTNTEQLRVSIPGGSLAIKYPAMGEGDPISHVRVSGIDFGTDLKVNIVEGGPGYKYVVLMFMGNPGVTYDAVVTLQTLQRLNSGTEMTLDTSNSIINTKNLSDHLYEVTVADSDDNDQDLTNDPKNMKQYSKKNNEVMQSTSTFYKFAKSEIADGDEDEELQNVSSEENDSSDDDDSEDEENTEGNRFSNSAEYRLSNEDESLSSNQEEREVSHEDENENGQDENMKERLYSEQNYNQFKDIPRAEQYRHNVDTNNADDNKPVDIVDDSLYDKYQDLKPHFGVGFRVYPQSFIYSKPYQDNSALQNYNKEDPVELEQMFNDEEVHNDARFKDGSNNIDSDYLVAEY